MHDLKAVLGCTNLRQRLLTGAMLDTIYITPVKAKASVKETGAMAYGHQKGEGEVMVQLEP